MDWKLRVLGSSSALPTAERMLSAQVLETSKSVYLFDCGEGTQFQLKKYGIKIFKIKHIFITHLHGDHFFGLFGFLDSMSMLQRNTSLNIYSPYGLKDIVNQVVNTENKRLGYEVNFIELDSCQSEFVTGDDECYVTSIPLKHSVPTIGYFVKQKIQPRNIDKSYLEEHNIPLQWFNKIKLGEDYIDEKGEIIPNNLITKPIKPLKSFAFISDTSFAPDICSSISNVTLLYHEATFADLHKDDAVKKMHSTAREAGKIANLAQAQHLLLGHFSTRYQDVSFLIDESKTEFNNTIAAFDGLEIIF